MLNEIPITTYDQIKRDIIAGVLLPGTPLVEVALAERYAVSRTPIREALKRLEQDDLIERAGRTMRVRTQSAEETFYLYEVRMILEAAAARAAAERRTQFDVAELQRAVAAMENPDLDIAGRMRTNRAFHVAIWNAAHNNVLVDTLDRLHNSSVRRLNTTLAEDVRWLKSLDQHRQMVKAIVTGDADTADAVMTTHLREGRDFRIEHSIDSLGA